MKIKDFYLNKQVLITGGAGFIGSHLAEKLLELGAKVTVLDNLSSGNLENLKLIKNQINFVNGDIRSAKTCNLVSQNQQIVFHQAAFVSAAKSVETPYECYEINVHGTLNVLNAACQNQTEKLLFASSAAVYGNTNQICHEDLECDPESPYGASKLTGEKYCQQYSKLYGLQTLALRYFNVWGERQDPDGSYAAAVAKFKDNLKNNLPITIYGDGHQTRDFIHVSQIVQANLVLAMLDKSQLNGQAINIATGESQSLLKMLETLKVSYPQYQAPIKFMPARAGDIKHSFANTQKFSALSQDLIKSIF
jgi:nucleoside-diphosphate-sugar epimerase